MSNATDPLLALMGEPEVVVAWLAQRGVLPAKNERGRYTLVEPGARSSISLGTKLLVVDNLEITSDERLAEVRRMVREHPRWSEPD